MSARAIKPYALFLFYALTVFMPALYMARAVLSLAHVAL